ncbi:MAG TPA: type VI secretion system ATPase TssH [Tepidisphaeraceae bacterium]|jgi:type VI secretion system protein VasG|nr:type VI secretion system ATPase TssH [Tepidisphaeraceae bacterium]
MSVSQIDSATARLSPIAHDALEKATASCLQRTNYKIEPEHWLLALLRSDGGDLQTICRHFGADLDALDEQLNVAIDNFKRGDGSRRPDFSHQSVEVIEQAWLVTSMRFGDSVIRSGHILLAVTALPTLWRLIVEQSPEMGKIKPESLAANFGKIAGASEAEPAVDVEPDVATGAPPKSSAKKSAGAAGASAAAGKKSALDRFTINMSALAQEGKIDPVLGRDREIDQCIQALSRRRQNNPILVGDAGVGKTAIVEGLALMLAEGKIKNPLLESAIVRSLDLGLLQAGAGVRGEFEDRLRSLIEEIRGSPVPIILFIDEAHMLLGAGGAEGQGDAANMLKPALARGELRSIAATTWAEYKKFFEKDAALARRFDLIKVNEPDEETAAYMIRGGLGALERHHKVKVLNEAVVSAVKLSKRYLPGRQLPDKAVSLLDTACTAVNLSTSVAPPAIQDFRRRIDDADHALRMLGRERAAGHGDDAVVAEIERLTVIRSQAQADLEILETRYGKERDLVVKLRTAWDKASDGKTPPTEDARRELDALRAELRAFQSDQPLAHALVDHQAVADVVSRWTGIPLGRMRTDELELVRMLERRLGERVIGQPHALGQIAETIRKSRAGLTDPAKPVGVFLLLGTSGVGKTETAISLAEILYGGASQLTVINMSEFKEEAKVSQLLGTSAGYVGYGEGGVLTEAVRRKPHSVLLLDEVEKANRAVHDIFLSVFDKGSVRDGEGRDIDFRNTLIIMTSNAASGIIAESCAADIKPSPETLLDEVQDALLGYFRPEFLGRTTPIVYYPLTPADLGEVAKLQLKKLGQRLLAAHRAAFAWDATVIEYIVSRCNDRSAGARVIERVLNGELLPLLSRQVLARISDGKALGHVTVSVDAGRLAVDMA